MNDSEPSLVHNVWQENSAHNRRPRPVQVSPMTDSTSPDALLMANHFADDSDESADESRFLLPTAAHRSRRHSKANRSSWLQIRTSQYDELPEVDADELDANGVRVWYDDYTTIDWIHDHLKDRIRSRGIKSRIGCLGSLARLWDSLQGWMLVVIIGIICGMFAAFIQMSEERLLDLRLGVCRYDPWMSHRQCCPQITSTDCIEWLSWSDFISTQLSWSIQDAPIEIAMNCFAFVCISALMATFASFMVVKTAVIPEETFRSLHGSSSSLLNVARKPSFLPDLGSSTFSGSRSNLISGGFPSPNESSKSPKCYSAGSGIPELKTVLSGFVIRGFLGMQTLIVKTCSLILAMASGLMIGKQGPLIHIACCIGNVVSRLFEKYAKNDGKRREMLSAASAAGVAVAFSAPIGGVLFSLEEVSYYFPFKTMWRSFFCALMASMTIKFMDPFGTGKGVLFEVTYDKPWQGFELVPFALLGVCGGLFGALFIKVSSWYISVRQRTKWVQKHPIREVLLVALMSALLNYWVPMFQVSNGGLVAELFSQCESRDTRWICQTDSHHRILSLLGITLLIKMMLMTVTLGIKVPAGFFIPSMTVGACMGRLMGTLMQHLVMQYADSPWFSKCLQGQETCVVPGVYAMVGAAAALCGTTRMTISLVVIMFELTGSSTYVLPIMLSIMLSKWTADALCPESLYDRFTSLQGHPYLDHKKTYMISLQTRDVMDARCDVIEMNRLYTMNELDILLHRLRSLRYSDDGGFPIVDGEVLVGYICANEVAYAMDMAQDEGRERIPFAFKISREDESMSSTESEMLNVMSKYINKAPLTVSVNSPVDLVVELFRKLGIKTVLVVREGKYCGVIHKKRLLRYLESS